MFATWKSRSARALPLASILVVASSLVGCYTMLQHPRSAPVVAESDVPSGSCLRCHSDATFDAGAVPWVEYYGSSSYPWINYYGSPWWYQTDWHRYDPGDCRDCPAPEAASQVAGRSAWGRRPRGGQEADPSRERTSSGLAPIAGAPAPAPTPAPPAIAGRAGSAEPADEPEAEEPEEPRKRSIRR